VVQLYRSDIKFIGVWNKAQHNLDIYIFSSMRDFVYDVWLTQDVNSFKKLLLTVKGVKLKEQKLRMSPQHKGREPSINSMLNAKFNVPKGKYNDVRKLILEFANKNEFAIHFGKATPDPNDITISLYRDNISIGINTLYPVNDVYISSHPLIGIKPTQDVVDELYHNLKNTVETIDGVKFEYTK
jgi:hypothetical protein